jgi:hypothetical protein
VCVRRKPLISQFRGPLSSYGDHRRTVCYSLHVSCGWAQAIVPLSVLHRRDSPVGDVAVFFAFGPLIYEFVFFSSTGLFDWSPTLLLSVSHGLLTSCNCSTQFFIPKPPFSTPTTRATSKMTDVTAFLPSPVFFHLSRSLQTPFQLTSQCQRALFSIVNFRRCSRRICRRRSPSLHRSWPARPRRCPGLATTRQSFL